MTVSDAACAAPDDMPDGTGGSATAASPAADRLTVTPVRRGRWTTLQLAGELDVATATALNEHIGAALEATPWIVLELSELEFCDSSGMNAFVRGWRRAIGAGGRLVLLRPRARLAEVLTRVGLDRHLEVTYTPPDGPVPD